MTDRRSKSHEVAQDAVEYVWDPQAGDDPERSVGAYTKRDAWIGGDGRLYHEPVRPVRSVPGTLESWVGFVAEEREIAAGAGDVTALCGWLDRHLDWITRQDWVPELADDLRELHHQLHATRVIIPYWRIGRCPVVVAERSLCKAVLLVALTGTTVRCWRCGTEWPRSEWLRLGTLIAAAS